MATLNSQLLDGGIVLALLITFATAAADERSTLKGEGSRAEEERDDNGLKIKLIWCPPGKFTMGSLPSEKGRCDDEDQVNVILSGFWLGKFEVTQGEWEQVMETAPWKEQHFVHEGAEHAATYVSFDNAIAFCRKLTEQERSAGRLPDDFEYTLPTEAQWEYSCRSRTRFTSFSFGDDEEKLSDYAWWGGIGPFGNVQNEAYPHRVGQKKPNPWGFFDMHGNVSEWCRDAYVKSLPGGSDPLVTFGISPGNHVVRGGSWFRSANYCRSAFRWNYGYKGQGRSYDVGFRLALSPTP